MARSKCVQCGKVRERSYLQQNVDLSGSLVWVCSHSVGNSRHYVFIGTMCYDYSPCELSFFKMQYDSIQRQNAIYNKSIAEHWIFSRVSREENVSPDLTFLLQ